MRKLSVILFLLCGAVLFATCSKDDEKETETLTAQKLAGLWVMDNAERKTDGDMVWTHVVEDYQFNTDGTGYYECYRLDGNIFVNATSVRDNGALHFTISGNTVTITGDTNNMTQTLTYSDGKLVTAQGKVLEKATAEQQTLVDQLYADWQGANSGSGDDNNDLNDVNGNVDVNNGGGGVNEVR